LASDDPLAVIVGYLLRQEVAARGSLDWVINDVGSYARVRGADPEAAQGLARRLIGDLKAMWADASLDYTRRE
jgi:hypothetical protein